MSCRLAAHRALLILASSALLALGGCASKPVPPRPAFKEIALIPVAPPASIYTENRMLALPLVPAMIASSIANRSKSSVFNERMATERAALGAQFTQMLLEELRAQGYSVHLLDNFKRNPDAPDEIEYDKLPTRDAVLHVWFSDVSMDSPRTSSDYLARLNVDTAFLPARDAPWQHQLYPYYRYGADADGNKPWSIPSEAKYRYPNFDALMTRSDDVAASWQVAMREMARRLARELPQPN